MHMRIIMVLDRIGVLDRHWPRRQTVLDRHFEVLGLEAQVLGFDLGFEAYKSSKIALSSARGQHYFLIGLKGKLTNKRQHNF